MTPTPSPNPRPRSLRRAILAAAALFAIGMFAWVLVQPGRPHVRPAPPDSADDTTASAADPVRAHPEAPRLATPSDSESAPARAAAGAPGFETVLGGRVVDPATDAPISSFQVAWYPTVGGEYRKTPVGLEPAYPPPSRSFDDQAGRFEIRSIPPGRWTIVVWAERRRPDGQSLWIAGDENRTDHTFRLSLGAQLRGRVVERTTGAPIEGAWVAASEDLHWMRVPANGRYVRSGKDGAFSLDGVSPGRVFVRAAAPELGFAAEAFALSVGADAAAEGFEIALSRSGSIEGSVSDEVGAPDPETVVRVARHGDATIPEQSVPIDSERRFQATNLAPGRYRVIARVDFAADVLVEEGRVTRVHLDGRGTTVRGRVLRGGEPVDDSTEVLAMPRDDIENGLAQLQVSRCDEDMTGENGEFELRGLPPGETVFVVGPPGPGTSWTMVATIPDRPESVLDLEVPTGVVTGRVLRGGDRSHVPGAPVVLRAREPAWMSGAPLAAVESDAEGRFRIERIGAGTYFLTAGVVGEAAASRPSLLGQTQRISVSSAESTAVEVLLRDAGALVVRVRSSKDLVLVGRVVRLRPSGGTERARESLSGFDGECRFDGLSEGTYVVELPSADGGVVHRETVVVSLGRETRVVLTSE